MDAVLEGGFADPVLNAQTTFRAIMNALANPGQPQKLAKTASTNGPLAWELASIMLTLSDQDTPIWLADSLRTEAVAGFIAFHTGARLVGQPSKAVFAVAEHAHQLPELSQFNLGTQEYPDRSTTVVLAVPAFTGGEALSLRGPGIRDHRHISPVGLPEDFIAQWADNREVFPRGIDLLLVAEGQVMGLPRSTRIGRGH